MLSLAVAFLACNVVALCQEVGTASREQDSPTALPGDSCPSCKSIPDHPCCIDGVYVDEAPPVINCPEGVSGNADCGEETIHFTFDPIVAIDNCDSDPPFHCLIANDNGADVDHLLDGGGDFPVGTTSISCWATDSCSQEATCQFDVVNTGLQGVHLVFELSPTVVPDLMTRGIDIKVSDCDAANPVDIEQCLDVEFGGAFNIPGHGSVQFEIPIGNWVCVEATDRQHTQRSTCILECEEIDGESVWFAVFEDTPILNDNCHWLINGNLNQDEHVDILDYVVYQSVIGGPLDPNTTCDTPSPHADINGDGTVNVFDFSFILLNFFEPQSDSCDVVCGVGATGPPSHGPRDSITVAELLAMGYEREEIDRMDRDHNGVVDLADLVAYLDDPTDDPTGPCCEGDFAGDDDPPEINCPESFAGDADCGLATMNFTFDPLVAIDECDGELPLACTITHDGGENVAQLLDGGGDFPTGTTSISCSATDSCGNDATCQFDVVNSGMNTVVIDIELSPIMASGPSLRGFNIAIAKCDAANPVVIEQCVDVEIGHPFNLPGHGTTPPFKVPADEWDCVTVADSHHTLARACPLTCEPTDNYGEVWYASFTDAHGQPDDCHMLTNGNLNQDEQIDILDYAIFFANIGPTDPDSPCESMMPHADINGDGVANVFDFTFILLNFFEVGALSCDNVCGVGVTAPPTDGPRDSVTVAELLAMGYEREEIDRMDRDANGIVDMADMAAYLDDPTDDPVQVAP